MSTVVINYFFPFSPLLLFIYLQVMDPVTEAFQANGFMSVSYTTIKTINRSLKTFYCTLYSFLKDVDAYGKAVERSQVRFEGIRFHGFISFHLDKKTFCDKKKLENCIITKEFCWSHIHAQVDSFIFTYLYYRDSCIAVGDIRYKIVARIKEMHYLIWGISELMSYASNYRSIVCYLSRVEEEMSERWSKLFNNDDFVIEFRMFEVKVRDFLQKVAIPPYTEIVLEGDEGRDFLKGSNIDNILLFARHHNRTDC